MFRLLRYFAVAAAVALIAVVIVLFVVYRQTAIEGLLGAEEQRNVVLAQSLGNAIWLHHADIIGPKSGIDAAGLSEHNESMHLDEEIKLLSIGLPVLKIKIYDVDGLVLYSTNPDEIGAEQVEHPEIFASALEGNTSSWIKPRNDSFLSTDGFVGPDIVETYLPMRRPDGRVYGVFELYSDVTGSLGDIRRMSTALLCSLLTGLALLYGGLLLVVRHAEKIMKSQYLKLRESQVRLVEKNRELAAEIVQRAEIEGKLREANYKAEAANRAKSRFLANMSHELRTPLNAVIGFSQVMADDALGRISLPRYREYAQDIRDSGRHLLALINNVLDLAKVESGRMDVIMAPFDVRNLVQDSVRDVKTEIAKNGNTLRLDCPRNLGTMVSDEIKVRSVLANLVGNAAKFTRDGHIEIAAWWESDSGGETARVAFRVSDTGIGMDERRVEEMFDEFIQHDNTIARKYGGTGLGLAICRRICEALGGDIVIESAPGKGTRVTVRLPGKRQVQEVEYPSGTQDKASPSAA